MDNSLIPKPSIRRPPRRTWPPDWGLRLLESISSKQSMIRGRLTSSPSISNAQRKTSFSQPSSKFPHKRQAYSATAQPELESWQASRPIRLPSLSSASSTYKKRSCGQELRQLRSRSWPRCNPSELTSRFPIASPQRREGSSSNCHRPSYSQPRTGLSVFPAKYCTPEPKVHSVRSPHLVTASHDRGRTATEADAEDEAVDSAGAPTATRQRHDLQCEDVERNRCISYHSRLANERTCDQVLSRAAVSPGSQQVYERRAPDFCHEPPTGAAEGGCHRKSRYPSEMYFTGGGSPKKE